MKKKFPRIDPLLIEQLEEMYPKLEYTPDTTREAWAFRGGQRDVLQKLKSVLEGQMSQNRGNIFQEGGL